MIVSSPACCTALSDTCCSRLGPFPAYSGILACACMLGCPCWSCHAQCTQQGHSWPHLSRRPEPLRREAKEGVALELFGRAPLPPGQWLPLVCGSAGAPCETPSKGLACP